MRYSIALFMLFAFICCLPAKTPTVLALPGLSPFQMVEDGGAVWFANGLASNLNDFMVGEITWGMRLRRYVEMPMALSHGIAAKHGRIWFAVNRADVPRADSKDVVGEFDTRAAKVTTYDIPTAASSPEGIAIRSDGSPLVAELNANAIGEVRNGKFIEHRLPGGLIRDYAGPASITIAQDGTAYFSVVRACEIGALSKRGTWRFVKVETVPSCSIAVASAGDLVWFVDSASGKIGLLRPTNAGFRIVHYSLPWAGARPINITTSARKVCFSLNLPFLGCYRPDHQSFERFRPPLDAGGASVLISRGRLWFGIGRLARVNPWAGAIGFEIVN